MASQRAPEAMSTRLRSWIEKTSVAHVARELRISNAVLTRIVAGLEVREGTVLMVAQRLSEVES